MSSSIISELRDFKLSSKMKFFVVAFAFFVIIASFGNVPVIVNGQEIVAANTRVQLGSLLRDSISGVVSRILKYIFDFILRFVSASVSVPLGNLLSALQSLPKPNVGSVLIAVLSLVNVNGESILTVLPKVVANTGINIPNLISVLASQIPAGSSNIPFGLLLSLLTPYLIQLLTTVLVNLLNSLS